MNYDDVKEKLCNIIKYIDNPDIRLQMLEQAKSVNTVRGVLYSLDKEKNGDLTALHPNNGTREKPSYATSFLYSTGDWSFNFC